MNFQPEAQTVEVDLSSVNCSALTDLTTGAEIKRETIWSVPLPAFGYGFYKLV